MSFEPRSTSRLLLVEDEPALAMTLVHMLKGEGYFVEHVGNGTVANDRMLNEAFDLVVLDVMLPGMSGFDVCRNAREKGVSTPILMLTARDQTADKVQGLEIGADDYVSKPFEPTELLARIHALLRRSGVEQTKGTGSGKFGDITVDLAKGRVFRAGERVTLSEREFALLKYLIDRRGSIVSRDQLLLDVWGYNTAPTTRTVDVHIALLRQKLESDPKNPQFIITVHAQGYRFVG